MSEKKRMKTIAELKKAISETENQGAKQSAEKTEAFSDKPTEKPFGKPTEKLHGKSAEKPSKEQDKEPPESDIPQNAPNKAEDAPTSDETLKKLSDAEARAEESMDRYVRALAEFDNFRKRTVKEKAAMYDNGVMDVVKTLLPVIDSFERALSSCGEEDKGSPVYKGMELIYKQFRQFMEANGITEIEALGCEFDPELHDAIAHTESDEFGENEITDVLQKGYMLKDKVLRHSMVRVAN